MGDFVHLMFVPEHGQLELGGRLQSDEQRPHLGVNVILKRRVVGINKHQDGGTKKKTEGIAYPATIFLARLLALLSLGPGRNFNSSRITHICFKASGVPSWGWLNLKEKRRFFLGQQFFGQIFDSRWCPIGLLLEFKTQLSNPAHHLFWPDRIRDRSLNQKRL